MLTKTSVFHLIISVDGTFEVWFYSVKNNNNKLLHLAVFTIQIRKKLFLGPQVDLHNIFIYYVIHMWFWVRGIVSRFLRFCNTRPTLNGNSAISIHVQKSIQYRREHTILLSDIKLIRTNTTDVWMYVFTLNKRWP